MWLITTGGTIGADPYENPERAPDNATFSWYEEGRNPAEMDPVVRFVLNAPGLFGKGDRYTSLPPRDSKDVTADVLRHIASSVAVTGEKNIIITHGTDTIIDNAALFAEMVKQQEDLAATVADIYFFFVGAMVPLLNDPWFRPDDPCLRQGAARRTYPSDGITAMRDTVELVRELRSGLYPDEKPGVYIGMAIHGNPRVPDDAHGSLATYFFDKNDFPFLVKQRSENTARNRLLLRAAHGKTMRFAQG